ncbi:MAG: hypothetical protein NUV78_01700 [Candidatus Zambryskibacteria bacterium]|nr:hypothetical protein [Candidatus Zambryskibacteria bacterium]
MPVTELLSKINQYILNPIILLAFAVAMLVFLWGIVEFIATQTADTKREEGKKKILYGLFGMFIMISAYGLIRLVIGTFGIDGPDYLGL